MFDHERIMIEQSRMPYGQFQGQYFDSLEDETIIKIGSRLGAKQVDQFLYTKIGPLYNKLVAETNQKRQAEIAGRTNVGEYFGEIGQNVKNLELTIGFTFWIKKTGVSLISLKDAQDRKFVLFYKGTDAFRKGKTVKLNAVVSKHQEYNGERQTLLTKVEKVG